jgi:hypothetical protein
VSLGERIGLGVERLRRLSPQLPARAAGPCAGDDRSVAAQRVDPQLGRYVLDQSSLAATQSTFSIATCSIPASTNTLPRGL